MICVHKDNRTEDQKRTHVWAVVARDNFMSGWGGAAKGYSRCAWAVQTLDEACKIESLIKTRKELKYVNVVRINEYRVPRRTAHFKIYVGDHLFERERV